MKDKTPALLKKNNQQNLLSNLVLYHPLDELASSGNKKNKKISIPQSNISSGLSPLKHKIS